MNTDIKITKKQKLAMILMGVTATLTQGARVQGSLPQPIERYLPHFTKDNSSLDSPTQVLLRLVLLSAAQVLGAKVLLLLLWPGVATVKSNKTAAVKPATTKFKIMVAIHAS